MSTAGLLPQPGGFEGLLPVAVVTLHPQHPPVAQRPDLEAPHPSGDPAAASSAGQPDSRNDDFARIDDLLCFDLEHIPHLMDCLDEAHEALVAAIDVWVENVLRKIDDNLGIEKLRRLHEIPLAPEAVAAAHYLNVLLRHRLLRQPGGFEGLVRIGVAVDPHEPPVGDDEHGREAAGDLDVAGLAPPSHDPNRYHAVA